MKQIFGLALGVSIIASPVAAQSGGASSHVAVLKAQAESVRSLVIRTAEKVPEDLYSFKPTPEIRSLGAVIGHIADAAHAVAKLQHLDRDFVRRQHAFRRQDYPDLPRLIELQLRVSRQFRPARLADTDVAARGHR